MGKFPPDANDNDCTEYIN